MKTMLLRHGALFFGIGTGFSASLAFIFFFWLAGDFSLASAMGITLSTCCFIAVYQAWLAHCRKQSAHVLIIAAAIAFECATLVLLLPFPNKQLPDLHLFLISYAAIFTATFGIILAGYFAFFILRCAIAQKAAARLRMAIERSKQSLDESL